MRTIELSLKEIFVFILYRWVPILLCMCLFAALLGGYAFIQQPRGEALQQALAEHEAKLSLAKEEAADEIEQLNGRKKSVEHMLNAVESLNPADRSVSTLKAQITYDPVMVDPYKLSNQYVAFFDEIPLVEVFNNGLSAGYDDDSLRALVSSTVVYVNQLPLQLDIQAIAANDFSSEDAVNRIFDYLVVNNEKVAAIGGTHVLNEVSTVTVHDEETNSFYSSVVAQQKNVLSDINAQIKSINSGISNIEKQQPGVGSSLYNMASLGAAIGLVIGILVAAMIYVYRIYVVLPEQIQNRLDIQYLGGIRRIKWAGAANSLAGNYMLLSTEGEAIEYIATNIASLIAPQSTILFTGSVPTDEIADFVAKLLKVEAMDSHKALISGEINANAQTIKMLPNADCVVLVERIKASRMIQVNRQLRRYEKSNKSVIGYVLF